MVRALREGAEVVVRGRGLLPRNGTSLRVRDPAIAPLPDVGSRGVRVSGLRHDGGLGVPCDESNVIGVFCPIAPCGRSSL